MKVLAAALTAVGAVDKFNKVPAASYCTAGECDVKSVNIHLIYFD